MGTAASVPEIHVRQATPADAEPCGRIFYEAFAGINRDHNFPPELPSQEEAQHILQFLFSQPQSYCVVAESGGHIVGSNCLDERGEIYGLGPVSVDPAVQNAGTGRALMLAVLDRAQQKGAAGVRLLQSTFHNRSLSLYAKLGFEARDLISVMQGTPAGARLEGCSVRPAEMPDLDSCNRLCRKVHGHTRSDELRDAIGQGAAVVVERDGRITGYASGFGYFGHAAAETNLDMKALLASAGEVSGPGILIPTRNAELFRWCLESGMRVLQPMTLMSLGMYIEPKGPYLPSVLY
jgi:predicted N-acetyltransferase YhbS